MKELVFQVPSSQLERDWFLFVNHALTSVDFIDPGQTVVFDFNIVRFMETDDFVLLACVIESFYIQGALISFVGGTDGFNSHLHNIKFKEYWKEGFDRKKFTLSRNKTTLCLWKISEEMIYSYSEYAKKYFESFTDNKDLVPLSSNIDEVFNNIFDHSKSPVTGYIITQYYPKNNKISFSVCDLGVGIPKSIRDAKLDNVEINEDWKAILKALEKGFSIHSTPKNRGFGLNNLLSLTENNNGSICIISNDGVVYKKAGEMYKSGGLDYRFSGTLIKVEVDLNSFYEKDDSEIIFDF